MAVCIRLLLIAALGAAAMAQAETAPDFSLTTQSGETLSLEAQRGKVVMINFWASWCAPCRDEMPLLDEIHDDYKDSDFTLFGINVEQNPEAAHQFLEKVGVSFPILFDSQSQVSRDYHVNAMPTTVMVDRAGQVRYVNRGFRPGDEEKYREQVQGLLEEE